MSNEENTEDENLVDALRGFAEIIEGSRGVATVMMLSGELFSEAADEIERLQNLIENLLSVMESEIAALRSQLDSQSRKSN